tara:strand:- start:1535 stop:1681 length:147 start_codon:yes stop_codon:yes gene_type:complete
MDFLFGFILGYVCKEIADYLKRLAIGPVPQDWDKEWDWMSPLQEDDLP